MISIKNQTNPITEGQASAFVMPARGHVSEALGCVPATDGTWIFESVERDRTADAAKGHLGHVAYVPGIHAWSPPIC